MEDNKELVTEVTENAEETPAEEIVDFVEGEETETEEPVIESEETAPVESEEDKINRLASERVDEILPKKIARREAKIRRDYEKKYKKLERIVNAGLGTENIDDATAKLEEFYASKGIQIPQEPQYSQRDLEVLANDDAEDIISGGYEDIVDEVNRLAQINPNDMSQRDKLVFTKLANKRKEIEEFKELEADGVKKEDLDNSEFKEFIKDLNPNLSLKRKWEKYQDSKPKKEIKTMGSMTNKTNSPELKDFYTREEALKFKPEDFDKNPKLEEIIENSMQKW